MWEKSLILFLSIFFLMAGRAQPPSSEVDIMANYQKRIKKEYLYRVYIPKDLADSFVQLNRLIDKQSLAKFKNTPEEQVASKLHFSLGRWIVHNWGFYGGSRLSHYLKKLGIAHPDDMAQFIIITYHRNLNKSQLNVKDLIDQYQSNRKKETDLRQQKGTIIFEERRKKVQEKSN